MCALQFLSFEQDVKVGLRLISEFHMFGNGRCLLECYGVISEARKDPMLSPATPPKGPMSAKLQSLDTCCVNVRIGMGR